MNVFALIDGELQFPVKNKPAFCQECGSKMIAVMGSILTHHWRHERDEGYSCSQNGKTLWHIEHQMRFPKNWIEVKWGNKIADVLLPGYRAIEFQSSNITFDEVDERRKNYSLCILVWNLIKQYDNDQILFWTENGKSSIEYKHAINFLDKIFPLWFDIGDDLLYLVSFERKEYDESNKYPVRSYIYKVLKVLDYTEFTTHYLTD